MLDNYDSIKELTELSIKNVRDEQDKTIKEFGETLKKIKDENVMIALKQLFHLTWLEFNVRSQYETLSLMAESRILSEEIEEISPADKGPLQ